MIAVSTRSLNVVSLITAVVADGWQHTWIVQFVAQERVRANQIHVPFSDILNLTFTKLAPSWLEKVRVANSTCPRLMASGLQDARLVPVTTLIERSVAKYLEPFLGLADRLWYLVKIKRLDR